jgi:hypothetical protein
MSKRLLILSVILTAVIIQLSAQTIITGQKLRDEVGKYGQATVIMRYPGRQEIDRISRELSILSVKDDVVKISISPLTADWFISRNYEYKLAERPGSKGIETAGSVNEATDWQTYPSYSDYLTIMQNFASVYPSICKLETIGTSINGKLVQVLKISDNAAVDEDEPEVFYTSTMHGDETGGFILMLRLADSLLKGYSTSSRIKDMVDNLQIWINPLANPDGAYRVGDVISGSTSVRYNANGIDLNRNFPDPYEPFQVYQKETIDMVKFLRKHRFVLSANFHSGAEVLNYPWDRWLSKYHADDSWFVNICRTYVDTVHLYSPQVYLNDYFEGIVRGAVWYVIYGGRQDFVTYELQGREVTMEISDSYVTPSAQLELLWIYNKRSLIKYLENALYGIHGLVKDSGNSLPVPARIFISGHDKDSSHVYSDTLTGSFTRMLMPGTWNLTFTANGYRDTTVNNITVTAGQKTDLVVNMKPIATLIDPALVTDPLIYPNPASSFIHCRLPEKFGGDIAINILDDNGKKVKVYRIFYLPGELITLDIQDLPAGVYSVLFRNEDSGFTLNRRFVAAGLSF